MAMEAEKAVLSRFVGECINGQHLDVMDEVVAEDFVEVDPLPGQGPGRAGLKEAIGRFVTAFPDLIWEVTEQVGENGTVASQFTWSGTHRAEFFGIPATGRHVTVTGMVFDDVRDGKLVRSRILMNTVSLLQQLGVIADG